MSKFRVLVSRAVPASFPSQRGWGRLALANPVKRTLAPAAEAAAGASSALIGIISELMYHAHRFSPEALAARHEAETDNVPDLELRASAACLPDEGLIQRCLAPPWRRVTCTSLRIILS
jgi:hypothetical protein